MEHLDLTTFCARIEQAGRKIQHARIIIPTKVELFVDDGSRKEFRFAAGMTAQQMLLQYDRYKQELWRRCPDGPVK